MGQDAVSLRVVGGRERPLAAPTSAAAIADVAALDAVRAHPAFGEVVVRFAAHGFDFLHAQDTFTRRAFSDLGLTSLYVAAVILDALHGLTAASLKAAAEERAICSPGRVTAFLEAALAERRLELEPGPQRWTRRPLKATPAFLRPFAEFLAGRLTAAGPLAPDLVAAARAVRVDDVGRLMILSVNLIQQLDPLPLPPIRRLDPLMQRVGGMRLIDHLICAQQADRNRAGGGQSHAASAPLIGPVRLNKAAAARVCGVSRPQIDDLIDRTLAHGLLAFAPDGTIFATDAAEEALGYYYAIYVQGLRFVAAAAGLVGG